MFATSSFIPSETLKKAYVITLITNVNPPKTDIKAFPYVFYKTVQRYLKPADASAGQNIRFPCIHKFLRSLLFNVS